MKTGGGFASCFPFSRLPAVSGVIMIDQLIGQKWARDTYHRAYASHVIWSYCHMSSNVFCSCFLKFSEQMAWGIFPSGVSSYSQFKLYWYWGAMRLARSKSYLFCSVFLLLVFCSMIVYRCVTSAVITHTQRMLTKLLCCIHVYPYNICMCTILFMWFQFNCLVIFDIRASPDNSR